MKLVRVCRCILVMLWIGGCLVGRIISSFLWNSGLLCRLLLLSLLV